MPPRAGSGGVPAAGEGGGEDPPTCEGDECNLSCGEGLMACGRSCANLALNVKHCGACNTACSDDQSCKWGACAASSGKGLIVPELELFLARYDVTLQQFADTLGVDIEDLGRVELTIQDLERLGVSGEILRSAGITREDLERIGIDVGPAP